MCSCDLHYQIVLQYSEQNIKLFLKELVEEQRERVQMNESILKVCTVAFLFPLRYTTQMIKKVCKVWVFVFLEEK